MSNFKNKLLKRIFTGIIVFSSLTITPFFADDGISGTLKGWIWQFVEFFIDAGIDFVGGIIMGFNSVMLRLINQATTQNLYGDIGHAFNSVFWFSKNYLIPLGYFIIILGLAWGIFKSLTAGPKGGKDDPIALVKRALIAAGILFITPYLILGVVGNSINTSSDKSNKNQVVKGAPSTAIVPAILDGVSSFDGDGKNQLSVNKHSFKIQGSIEDNNSKILQNGMDIVGFGEKASDAVKFGKDAKEGEDNLTAPNVNVDSETTILGKLSSSLYSDYADHWSSRGLIWKILYVVVFIVQPALIIWSLLQIIWVFVKRTVSLILTACLAPIAVGFYPSETTTEVTSRWAKMLVGYGLTTTLTFAFAKLGAFVYASVISVQYSTKNFILTVILNFACLAILSFVREMETYANSLGGNLVGFKSSAGNVVARLVTNWGERGIRAPWTAAKMVGKPVLGGIKKATSGVIGGYYKGRTNGGARGLAQRLGESRRDTVGAKKQFKDAIKGATEKGIDKDLATSLHRTGNNPTHGLVNGQIVSLGDTTKLPNGSYQMPDGTIIDNKDLFTNKSMSGGIRTSDFNGDPNSIKYMDKNGNVGFKEGDLTNISEPDKNGIRTATTSDGNIMQVRDYASKEGALPHINQTFDKEGANSTLPDGTVAQHTSLYEERIKDTVYPEAKYGKFHYANTKDFLDEDTVATAGGKTYHYKIVNEDDIAKMTPEQKNALHNVDFGDGFKTVQIGDKITPRTLE